MSPYSISQFKHQEIKNVIPSIKAFRKKHFSSPPYSYAYDEAIEDAYLNEFINDPNSVCITLSENEKTLALITGTPLVSGGDITSDARESFQQAHLDYKKFFYICELIVNKNYQGQGYGKLLLEQIENYIKDIQLDRLCFLTICKNNAKKNLWRKAGYKQTEIYEHHSWPTFVDDKQVQEVEHKLVYWIKHLTQR